MKVARFIHLLIFVLMAGSLACSKGNDTSSNPPTTPQKEDQNSDGRIHRFSVGFAPIAESSAKQNYLTYSLVIARNTGSNGTINIYDCMDSTCNVKYLSYKADCNLAWMTCKLTDSQGQEIKVGNFNSLGESFKINAADLGNVDVIGQCHKFEAGVSENWCTYIALTDPRLRMQGFYNQYYAAEFVSSKGSKTELKIYHLESH